MATYAATDFHGMYGLWEQIKNYMKPDDTLYYLGDAIDRGPRGFELFMDLLDDPRVIFICGNHEDMMYQTYAHAGVLGRKCLKHWEKNGGKITFENMKNIPFEIRKKYIEQIPKLPTMAVFKNEQGQTFLLTHAGCTPNKEYWNMKDSDWNYANLWDRKHIIDDWPQDKNNEHKKVIHGHTPVQFMHQLSPIFERNDGGLPVQYCDGHKVNLDSGAFATNIATLYNLDLDRVEMLFRGDFEDEYFNK